MKKVLVLFVVFILPFAARAQDEICFQKSDFWENAIIEVNSGYGLSGKNTCLFLGENLGYRFSKCLSAFAHHEKLYRLRDNNGMKSYLDGNVLGGGLALMVLGDEKAHFSCEFRAMMGHSIGNSDFSHTLYDAGFSVNCGKYWLPTIGVGFRHMNVQTAGLSNVNYFYMSIGFAL